MPRTIEVEYWGGRDTWVDAGTWDIIGGVLQIYHVETKRVLVAYGPHQWIRARWTHPLDNDGDDRA